MEVLGECRGGGEVFFVPTGLHRWSEPRGALTEGDRSLGRSRETFC